MSTVEIERDGSVVIITITRPEVRNAIDRATADALAAAFRDFDADDSLAVAVLTGAGGCFCAGADLRAVAGLRAEEDGDAPLGVSRMLLGKPVTYEADGVAMIGEDGAQPVMFQQVEQYTAPRWPDPAYPQQIHLDVTVQDVDAAERAALDIGATRLDGAGPNWRVYADPVGKPFCLVWTV